MNNARPKTTEASALDKRNFNTLTGQVKTDLLSGQAIRLIDYKPEQRAQVIASIATLRDELPVRCRWVTVRESYLSETRLRARVYAIDGAFLRGEGVAHD